MNIDSIFHCLLAIPTMLTSWLVSDVPRDMNMFHQAPRPTITASPTPGTPGRQGHINHPGQSGRPDWADRQNRDARHDQDNRQNRDDRSNDQDNRDRGDYGHKPTATPRPTASPVPGGDKVSCPGETDSSQTAAALVCLTAKARVAQGLQALTANDKLMDAAEAKAQDMSQCGMSHTACGRDANYWIENKGYDGKCSGENIAMGQPTAKAVFEAWMKSPGHRANILNDKFTDIGVAQTDSDKGPMWAMELGGC